MTKINKATAALVAGAIVTIIGAFVTMTGELQGAVQTLVTAALVWLVANGE